jgi:tRNA modification GTPase
MHLYLDDGPIIACSTGTNFNSAIAIIRLSGFSSLSLLSNFFSLNLESVKPRFSHLTNIIFHDQVFDNILLTFFPKEASFNGENILELSVHGNQLNISRIIEVFTSSKLFRLAGPGEFSYRALKNGKLSLSQVEGLDMLLNANSNLMLDQGLELLQGELHQKYLSLYDIFLKLKSSIEISIDFSEDVGDEQTKTLLDNSLKDFLNQISSLYTRTQGSISSLMSPDIVICGETNAGKSSLFNLLLKHNRSIVSNIPGTTRDYVSEITSFSGISFRLIDTAGVRDSNDVIESEGIIRAFEALGSAFYKILIINPMSFNEEFLRKFSHINFDLIIFSHADSLSFRGEMSKLKLNYLSSKQVFSAYFLTGSIEPLKDFGPIEPLLKSGPIEPLLIPGPIEPIIKKLISNKYNELTKENPILFLYPIIPTSNEKIIHTIINISV